MTMKIVCSAASCKFSSEDEDSSNITFISFPNSDTAAAWAHNCGRPDLIAKAMEDLHTNHYICSDHIEDQFFISKTNPIIIAQGAIPTIFRTSTLSDNFALEGAKDNYSAQRGGESFRLTEFVDVCQPPAAEDKVRGSVNSKSAYDDVRHVSDSVDFSVCSANVDGSQATPAVTFANLCRMCGLPTADGTDIFENDGSKMGVREKIILHTPITIDSEDSMPRKICSDCCDKLDSTHSLIVACLRTDMRLRRLLDKSDPVDYDSKFESLVAACSMEIADEINPNNVVNVDETTNNIAKTESSNKFDCEWKQTLSVVELQQFSLPPSLSEPINDNAADSNELKHQNCDKTFDKKHDFDIHESSHGKKSAAIASKRICGHCSACFNDRKDLQSHIAENHDDETLFKCGICDKTYDKWSSLDVHEATHRHDKPYLCDLCGKSFKHSNNLRGHKRIHLEESKKKRHVCDICGSAFRSRFHLREHGNQHNGNKPYACEDCGKTFYKRIQLRQHRLSHGSNKHVCPICGASFNRRGNMNSHLKRHEKPLGTYACSVCDLKCKSMSELKIHRKQHTNDEIIESIKLRNAKKIVWRCKICDKLFSKRAILLTHENTHNDERRRFECEKCGKKLANKNSLRYHEKSMHTNERSHACQFCDHGFVSKEAKLVHERIHTGERPYVCKICGMSYRCSSNLSQHSKIHSSLRPHVCRYCDKTFTRKGALNVHERIHTGAKPYVCEICDRSFSQKNDMLKHAKIHRTKTTNCDECGKIFDTKTEILQHLESHAGCSIEDSIVRKCGNAKKTTESYGTSVNRSNIVEESSIGRN